MTQMTELILAMTPTEGLAYCFLLLVILFAILGLFLYGTCKCEAEDFKNGAMDYTAFVIKLSSAGIKITRPPAFTNQYIPPTEAKRFVSAFDSATTGSAKLEIAKAYAEKYFNN